MRFKADEYDEQVDALLDELIDARTYEEFGGDVGHARFAVALELGLSDGDEREIGADGYMVLSTPAEKIEANVARAREARARGEPLIALVRAGAFD
ncbi:MAG: hypothetical protein M5U08_08345 [Burkholderiales bacterium]|nr:hypothetical protein [Burkholderiales bacterium]